LLNEGVGRVTVIKLKEGDLLSVRPLRTSATLETSPDALIDFSTVRQRIAGKRGYLAQYDRMVGS
jgi:hypothetical protein